MLSTRATAAVRVFILQRLQNDFFLDITRLLRIDACVFWSFPLWLRTQDRVDPGEIRAQELTAKVGSVVALITAAVPLVISLKDANK